MQDYKKHIVFHEHSIQLADRIKKYGHKPLLIWFTGLSGSGKSTLASSLETYLHEKGYHTYILDGDNVRKGLNNDLDFSEEARRENIRRIAEVAKLFVDAGMVVSTAFISPFKEDREQARKLVGKEHFVEVFIDCPLEVCEGRDVKGLYKKARAGEIKHFTGISSPFESPENPDVLLNTGENSIEDCLSFLIKEIEPRLSNG